jgi:hypothetical protein
LFDMVCSHAPVNHNVIMKHYEMNHGRMPWTMSLGLS